MLQQLWSLHPGHCHCLTLLHLQSSNLDINLCLIGYIFGQEGNTVFEISSLDREETCEELEGTHMTNQVEDDDQFLMGLV